MSVANKPGHFRMLRRLDHGNRQFRRHGWKKLGQHLPAYGVSWLMAGLLLPYMPKNEEGAVI